MKIRNTTLPVLRPLGDDDDVKAIKEVIDSGWWGKGPKVELLEKKFADLVGSKYAVAVTSNTVGLDLYLKAKKINSGNILSPTVSFISTAVVPIWNNCKTVLCDIEPITRNICTKDVKKNIDKNTKAVIVINYAGIPADIKSIRKIFDGPIIEDCALSCYYPGAGRQGDVAIWSFQAVKTISSGDGGIITTDSKELYESLKLLSNFGIPQDTYQRAKGSTDKNTLKPGYVWDFTVSSIGYKAYMNDITASLLLSQLDKLDDVLKVRMEIQKRYNAELPDEIIRPHWSNTCQFYSASVKSNVRDKLMEFLSTKKIHTTVHFKPLHLHPIFKQEQSYPIADNEWHKFISLPCHAGMNSEDIDYVIYWVKDFFSKK